MALNMKKKPAPTAPYVKQHVQEVFDEIVQGLSVKEFRPLNQRYWAQKLGMLQPRISQIFATLVTDEILLAGEPDGNLKTYKLNARHPFITALAAKAS